MNFVRREASAAAVELLCVLLVLVAPFATGWAQSGELSAGKPFLFHPQRLPEGALWKSVGFTSIAPPVEITEEIQVRWPALDLHVLYGLPEGFSLDGRGAVQVLQNRFSGGAKWATDVGPISISLGWDLAYWFGFLEVAAFDSKAHGWESTPNISFGHDFGSIAATFKTEILFNHSFKSTVGESTVSTSKKSFLGVGFSFLLEQPFYKTQYLTLGFRALYTKFYWQTWSLYSTFDRYLFYPEMTVGFIL